MTKLRTQTALLLALGLALGAGAAWAQEEEAYEGAGFLESYDNLAPDPEEKDSKLIYKNPDYTAEQFHGIRIAPLIFYFHPSSNGIKIEAKNAAKMAELIEKFNATFFAALKEEGLNLVEEAGPGIIDCRIAITDLGRTKSGQRIIPHTRAAGTGRGRAAMEGECVDGENGTIVAQVVKTSKGARTSGVTTWAGAESAIRNWAGQIAERFSAARKQD